MTTPADSPENPSQRDPSDAVERVAEPTGEALPADVLAKFRAQFYSGLIPHPDILKGYEELVPGAAKQILDTFNDQSRHRMALESKTIDSDIHRSWAGLAAGTVICLAILVIARELILAGHALQGTFLGTVNLATIVGIFVYVGRERRAERVEKAKLMQPPETQGPERSADLDAELHRRARPGS
jgi:uncharacterized membrane protein